MSTDWEAILALKAWLDRSQHLPDEVEHLVRVLKLTEEAGEVAEAYIGMVGQNPRKGVTHTMEDVRKELCDVIATGMMALATLDSEAEKTFSEHLRNTVIRASL